MSNLVRIPVSAELREYLDTAKGEMTYNEYLLDRLGLVAPAGMLNATQRMRLLEPGESVKFTTGAQTPERHNMLRRIRRFMAKSNNQYVVSHKASGIIVKRVE